MSDQLAMEIRSVDTAERTLVGVVAPYDQTTYLVADPGGERIMRGAFNESIRPARQTRCPVETTTAPNAGWGSAVVLRMTPTTD